MIKTRSLLPQWCRLLCGGRVLMWGRMLEIDMYVRILRFCVWEQRRILTPNHEMPL